MIVGFADEHRENQLLWVQLVKLVILQEKPVAQEYQGPENERDEYLIQAPLVEIKRTVVLFWGEE